MPSWVAATGASALTVIPSDAVPAPRQCRRLMAAISASPTGSRGTSLNGEGDEGPAALPPPKSIPGSSSPSCLLALPRTASAAGGPRLPRLPPEWWSDGRLLAVGVEAALAGRPSSAGIQHEGATDEAAPASAARVAKPRRMMLRAEQPAALLVLVDEHPAGVVRAALLLLASRCLPRNLRSHPSHEGLPAIGAAEMFLLPQHSPGHLVVAPSYDVLAASAPAPMYGRHHLGASVGHAARSDVNFLPLPLPLPGPDWFSRTPTPRRDRITSTPRCGLSATCGAVSIPTNITGRSPAPASRYMPSLFMSRAVSSFCSCRHPSLYRQPPQESDRCRLLPDHVGVVLLLQHVDPIVSPPSMTSHWLYEPG